MKKIAQVTSLGRGGNKRWFKSIIVLLILIALWMLYTMTEITQYAEKTEDIHTDAAIVLGAAVRDDIPSPVFQARIDHAIKLYLSGDVDVIIFTGGRSPEDRLSESEVGKQYAMVQGVPESHIFVETSSRITEQNLKEALRIGDQKGFTTYTLVSDPLHMRRAIVIGKNMGMNVVTSPTRSSKYVSLSTKFPFLLRETFLLIGYRCIHFFR
ncbi:YdcF family protein [Paenibacillus sp. Marseille-Q4541]|uniref:YdcF family protein n=1 Tax=Paenibacillus sp. Marseille-Q4541 TaxID=2831522 RepID=UPI001BA9C93A|nr:YdcF family protein [Paenibacillus sp. Marseille-Q4541]